MNIALRSVEELLNADRLVNEVQGRSRPRLHRHCVMCGIPLPPRHIKVCSKLCSDDRQRELKRLPERMARARERKRVANLSAREKAWKRAYGKKYYLANRERLVAKQKERERHNREKTRKRVLRRRAALQYAREVGLLANTPYEPMDSIDQMLDASFPASDPPSYSVTGVRLDKPHTSSAGRRRLPAGVLKSQWYANNRERIREKENAKNRERRLELRPKWRAYYAKNRERIRAKSRLWREANRDHLRIKAQLRRRAHGMSDAARSRSYYAKNRDVQLLKMRERYAAKRNAINEKRRQDRKAAPEKYRSKARAYYAANRDKMLVRDKSYRTTEEYKEYRRERYWANRSKIIEQQKARYRAAATAATALKELQLI